MKGIEFPEATTRLMPAEGTEDSVYPLHVWSDGKMVISKWKMTWRERFKVLLTGVVWFDCWHKTHPPINMRVDYPFEKSKRSIPRGWVILGLVILSWLVVIGGILLASHLNLWTRPGQ